MKVNAFFILFLSLVFCDPFNGYTLITGETDLIPDPDSPISQWQTILIDNNHNIINSWDHDFGISSIAYLTSDSLLYVPARSLVDDSGAPGGIAILGGRFQIINWAGDIVWDYQFPLEICYPHHDIEILPNGNILALCNQFKSAEEAISMGLSLDIENPMMLDMIVEIEPVGDSDANIVWKWHFWDRLIQNVNPFASNYADISENPQLLNINCPTSGQGSILSRYEDWTHCNSISYNPIYNQIVISSRHLSEFYVIDHSTTIEEASSHSGGIYGKGGDFLYRWGNPQNYTENSNSSQVLSAQHGVNWIPPGFPGEGNFILFNNRHNSEENVSAVLEIESIMNEDGSYSIGENNIYGPNNFYWIYQASNLFSNYQSGAFRLPNGNTLITSTAQGRVFEISESGDSQWEYLGNLKTARAIKYPLDYFNSLILGDINQDLEVNVLDIVMLVNVILASTEANPYCDLNDDGIINILDVVQLVNLIIN